MLFKRFSSFEGLELRTVLSGDPLGSSGYYSSLETDDAHETSLGNLSIANFMASALTAGGEAAPLTAEDPVAEPLQEGHLVNVTVQVQNLAGQPITSVAVGQDFKLAIFVDDLRTESDIKGTNGEELLGVFSAYVKANFDTSKISLVDPNSLIIDPFFTLVPLKDTATPGSITAGASTLQVVVLDGSPQLLWTVTLRATAAGTATFNTEFAGDGLEVVLYGTEDPPLTEDQMSFNSVNLEVLGAPSYAINDVSHSEGDSGTVDYVFTVTRSGDVTAASTVVYNTVTGSANEQDFIAHAATTLSFAVGQSQALVTVQVNGDAVVEADETFSVVLSNPSAGTTISDDTGIGTITNDDFSVLGITGVTQLEGNETNQMLFTVTLTKAGSEPILVPYSTADGTATVGDNDYAPTSGTLTFAAGSTASQVITVVINGDTVTEDNETFAVNLSEPVNAEFDDSNGVAIGTLTNDDGPRISISNPSVSVVEGDAGEVDLVFTVTLSNAEGESTVVFATGTTGTATSGVDYTPTSGTLTFDAETTTATITVKVQGDLLDEIDETFTLNLSNPTNATLEQSSAVGTITDDDDSPQLSVSAPAATAEGDTGTTPFVFTVTLSEASGKEVTVAFATTNGTAAAGSDYTATSGTVTFAPGTTSQLVTVLVNGDTTDENDETFSLVLSGPSNATLETATAVATITDDDNAPTVTFSPVTQNEGNSGTTNFVFTATLSAASDKTVTVAFATSDGTATAGSDYTATSGTVTFAPGATTALVTVAVLGDTATELTETFTLNLSDPENATLASESVLGTITNDDALPTVTISDASQNEGTAGQTPLVFTVTLSAASQETVTVVYSTADGTATIADNDYVGVTNATLTFAPGSTTALITIQAVGDTKNEANETFTVNLSGATGANLTADTQGVGTIVNDDGPPALTISDVTATEGDSGTKDFVFTVTMSSASSETVTVNFATVNGTATIANNDYLGTSGTLTFAPGVTVQTITVKVVGDLFVEPNETFSVVLANASSAATILDGTGLGTIQNDATDNITITPSTIMGKAFMDFNGNGEINGLERALTGMHVTLQGFTSSNVQVNRTTTVGANGQYAFANLDPGTYTISFDLGTFDTADELKPGDVDLGNSGGTELASGEGFTITIDSPGGVNANNYNFTTSGYVRPSQRLFMASRLGNLNPPIADVVVGDLVVNGAPLGSGEVAAVTVTGTGTVGATISLVASDGDKTTDAATTVVGDDGVWTIINFNVSGLADGTITFTATATGLGGSTDTATVTTTKDTSSPAVAITNVTDPIGSGNHTSTSISGTGEIGATISVVVSGTGTSVTPPAVVVGAGGTWTVSGINVSGLADGTLTYTVTATDAAGNTTTTSITSTKDTVAPSVAVTAVTDPVNASNESAVTISGTGTPGASISVVVSDGVDSTDSFPTTVAENGTWSISNINVSDLADGELTFTVTATDGANNTAQTTITANKNTSNQVAITSLPEFINAAGAEDVTISGTGEVGATISLTVTGTGTPVTPPTVVVGQNGTWSISGVDVSGLADGTLTFTITATDASLNTTTATDTAVKDTQAPIGEITSVTDPITGGNAGSTTISGSGEIGAAVSVVASDGTNSTTAQAGTIGEGGNWSFIVDVGALNDGTITYTVTFTDAAGNTSQEIETAEKTTLVIGSFTNPINASNQTNVSISGTGRTGATVTLVVSGGGEETDEFETTVDENGDWSFPTVNVSDLPEGTITYTVTSSDAGGTIVQTATANKDTVAPNVAITSSPEFINAAGAAAVSVSGTAEVGATVTIEIRIAGELVTAPAVVVGESGTWSFSDLDVTGLPDGGVNIWVAATDAAGNVELVEATAIKDTVAPEWEIIGQSNPITLANFLATSIFGSGEPGGTVTVVASDGVHSTEPKQVVVPAGGIWSVDDIDTSTLNDGTITYTVTITDLAGNVDEGSVTSEKTTLMIGSFTNPINAANQENAAIEGTGQPGATVDLIVFGTDEDILFGEVPVHEDGTWSFDELDLSSLPDGPIGYMVIIRFDGGDFTKTVNATKDTSPPTVAILSLPELVNQQTSAAVTISGSAEEGASVVVSFFDGANTITLPAVIATGGVWSIEEIDLSSLADGTITATVTASDAAGNTDVDTGTFDKDTTGPELLIDQVTDPIAAAQASSVSISGTSDGAVSISVVASNGESSTGSLPAQLEVDGSWSLVDIDLTSLPDGTVTFEVTATDEAGNVTTETITALKDTVAEVTISSLTHPVNSANQENVTISGTGEAGATVVVSFFDGVDTITLPGVLVSGEGTWSIIDIDLSSLAEGEVAVTATATDILGNTDAANDSIIKDTVAPEVTILDFSNPITALLATNAAVSGSSSGAVSVTVKASDGVITTDAVTATLDPETGEWFVEGLDVSDLADGEITFTVTATDAVGNEDSDTVTADKFTVGPTLAIEQVTDPIFSDNDQSVNIFGTSAGAVSISVVASNGATSTPPTPAVLNGDGSWVLASFDVGDVLDGEVTFTVTATNNAGNVTIETITATKDTVTQITIDPTTVAINIENVENFSISGTGEVGATVTVVIFNGEDEVIGGPVVVGAEGTWTIEGLDLSGLPDGSVVFLFTAVDSFGNYDHDDVTLLKDTIAPEVTVLDVTDPISADNQDSVAISGTSADAVSISVVASNGETSTPATPAVLDGDGTWSLDGLDVTALPDGTITFTVTAIDVAGNVKTDTITANKDTATTVTIDPITESVNIENAASFTVSGTGEVGATITLVVGDGEDTVTPDPAVVGEDGTWTIAGLDLSALADGPIVFEVTATDTLGNENTDQADTVKDTIAPEVEVVEVTDPINAANAAAVHLSGSSAEAVVILVVATDGVTTTPAVEASLDGDTGLWSLDNLDVSALADGPITLTVTAIDQAGNVDTDTVVATKDTVAPAGEITDSPPAIDPDNETDVTLSGTGEADAEVSVVATDGLGFSVTVLGSVTPEGTWSLSVNVSGLADGPITFAVEITDAAGNSTTDTVVIDKDSEGGPLVALAPGEDDDTLDLLAGASGDAASSALDAALADEDDWLPLV